MTKEELYDADIAPLMRQIIAACRRGNIDFAASFALDEGAGDDDGPLMCSTVILGEDSLPGSSRLLQKMRAAIRESMAPPARESMAPPATAFTITQGQGDSK